MGLYKWNKCTCVFCHIFFVVKANHNVLNASCSHLPASSPKHTAVDTGSSLRRKKEENSSIYWFNGTARGMRPLFFKKIHAVFRKKMTKKIDWRAALWCCRPLHRSGQSWIRICQGFFFCCELRLKRFSKNIIDLKNGDWQEKKNNLWNLVIQDTNQDILCVLKK